MKLEITKEKVLEAASKCPDAKRTLETLFPEAFEKTKRMAVFTGVTWKRNVDYGGVFPTGSEHGVPWHDLFGKPKMKMTLEWDE